MFHNEHSRLRILDLRERLRINPEAPAKESGLDELELRGAWKILKKRSENY